MLLQDISGLCRPNFNCVSCSFSRRWGCLSSSWWREDKRNRHPFRSFMGKMFLWLVTEGGKPIVGVLKCADWPFWGRRNFEQGPSNELNNPYSDGRRQNEQRRVGVAVVVKTVVQFRLRWIELGDNSGGLDRQSSLGRSCSSACAMYLIRRVLGTSYLYQSTLSSKKICVRSNNAVWDLQLRAVGSWSFYVPVALISPNGPTLFQTV